MAVGVINRHAFGDGGGVEIAVAADQLAVGICAQTSRAAASCTAS